MDQRFSSAMNLSIALKGLKAPFAIALSRRLATDWLHARECEERETEEGREKTVPIYPLKFTRQGERITIGLPRAYLYR
jgi:hypothetical protein